ncbi:MAG TPA: CoB--CoM heterodisulfide reductase iron-sulfur subunit B family protein [Candidatus Krumholzibacteria bacterium]|nr:CoB--CoM heterodisulfide reductase iron-sulfur subunit B family protein [Candidatus Krumholzibacteria bacterium]HPD73210.1 CoB--CoM heterodisulfide reductase iron-sulfur subunit B family protein [Candidatus Krumholzibacteria bacterium]HRY40172.1 CoB--CoM heterodisulfide reductase iron-sulfur subunit B family protein [Candidatus Krumholzibacteria bacterium]
MKLGLFPGCSLEGSSREYLESLTAIAPKLGLELTEVPDWNCCGATAAHSLNAKLALALPARNLALAERAGITDLLVPCSACYARLMATHEELDRDEERKREIADIIELPLQAGPKIVSILDVLSTDGVAGRVSRPFAHRVACYYGCYLTRPPKLSTLARTEDPREMDDLVRAAGAEPVAWAFKTECCGAGLSITRTDLVAELAGRVLDDAERRGAEAIVVACPMCHTNLDLRRDAIDAHRGRRSRLPVLYLTQLIGLALGLDERALGLHRHHVPVRFRPDPQPTVAQEI